jgi:O-antigen biosynthesis protein
MSRTAVFFVYVWPEPLSSAAGLRTLELMRYLQGSGWQVKAVSPSRESPHRQALEKMGVGTHSADPNFSAEVEGAFSTFSPALAIFDRFVMEEQFGWSARAAWPNCLQLVDTQDLHCLRRARERLARSRAGFPDWNALEHPGVPELGDDLVRELASLYRADGALVVSSFERDFLLSLDFPPARLLWQPLEGAPESAPPGFASRHGFAFLGNFRHPPNRDSVVWLVAELWPRLREKLPEAELHLYGAYPPAEISRHQGGKGIFSHGPVENHRAALSRHRALLAPLRFGAGIKGKVLEAWSTGTPVLGSRIALEGMGYAGDPFRTEEEFVKMAVELHENEADFAAAREAGFRALAANFAPAELCARFLSFVNEGCANLQPLRERNLIGAMLRHHQANSTKYFSRWIEAKNRK